MIETQTFRNQEFCSMQSERATTALQAPESSSTRLIDSHVVKFIRYIILYELCVCMHQDTMIWSRWD